MLKLATSLKTSKLGHLKVRNILSVPKEGAEMREIDDIGPVAEDDLPDNTKEVTGVKMIGAVVNSYNACLACNSKVILLNEELSKCTKCDLEQLNNSNCKFSATFYVSIGCNFCSINAFTDVFKSIVWPGQDIASINLLMAPPFTCILEDSIITSASRP